VSGDRILEFGLAHGGVELDPAIGYHRVKNTEPDGRAPPTVDFGPFTRPVIYDTVLVVREQQSPLGHYQMPAGVVCSVQVEVED